MKVILFIVLVFFSLFSFFFYSKYIPKTHVEKVRAHLMKNEILGFRMNGSILYKLKYFFRDEGWNVFMSSYYILLEAEKEQNLSVDNLFCNKPTLLGHILWNENMKHKGVGIDLLRFGKLSKKQKQIILLMYEPYPNLHELALKIVNSPEETGNGEYHSITYDPKYEDFDDRSFNPDNYKTKILKF